MLAASEIPAAPVVVLMAIGVVIAIAGHATKSKGAVATGIAVLFIATAGMIVGGFAAYQNDESDPRPGCPGGDCRSSESPPGRDAP
jgi:hypothetical protein